MSEIPKQAHLPCSRSMPRGSRHFVGDDSGAVTTDWVVLTAAIVGLSVSLIAAVGMGIVEPGSQIRTSLDEASISTLGAQTGNDEEAPVQQTDR